jgi:hypothetical protein
VSVLVLILFLSRTQMSALHTQMEALSRRSYNDNLQRRTVRVCVCVCGCVCVSMRV